MSKQITGNQKHMTMDDRVVIEKGLDQKRSLRSIAAQLGKDPTTISKEIKKHRSFQEHNHFNEPRNKCALSGQCRKKNICGTYAPVCRKMCRLCNHCNSHCEEFTPSQLPLLTFHFSGLSFMMAYLLDSKESRHVKNVFDSIEHAIVPGKWNLVFSMEFNFTCGIYFFTQPILIFSSM